jgi:flagellar hook assembly protein FlgD
MTHVIFELARTGPVELGIYDVRGQLVQTLVSGVMQSGRQDQVWQGQDGAGRPVASGIYFCRLTADGVTQTRKMLLAR